MNEIYSGYRVASGHVPLDRRALALSASLTRRDPVGSGLGLFVSREVARRQGGDL